MKRIEREAIELGVLSGTYVVNTRPLKELPALLPRLVQDALDYIGQTRDLPSADRKALANTGTRGWEIQKVHSDKDAVHSPFLPGALFEGDVVSIIHGELEAAARAKLQKLAKLEQPKILLLLDRLLYGDSEHWIRAASECSGLDHFAVTGRATWEGEFSLLRCTLRGPVGKALGV